MKKMKRILTAGILFCLLMGTLAGCGGSAEEETPVEYPAMELVDISGMELATAENDTAKYQYPADTWEPSEEVLNSLMVYEKGTMDTEEPVSVTVQVAGERKKQLSQDFMEEVLKQLEKNASLTVNTCELRSFNGEPMIYMENSFTFNDEVIDQMIENKQWTEESIEKAGGREAILSIPDSNSIIVYSIVDGNLVVYGGAYYTEEQKQPVVDAINVMMQTTEVK